MKALKTAFVIIFAAALAGVFDLFFSVSEYEQAVITRFGAPIASVREAGLHLKAPFIDRISRLEKRSFRWDSGPLEISDRDGVPVRVEVVARWRIADPVRFLQIAGTYEQAYARLDDTIDPIIKDRVSANSLPELVRSSELIDQGAAGSDDAGMPGPDAREVHRKIVPGRDRIMGSMLKEASGSVSRFGMELIDLKLRRLSYPESITAKVFERMVSERKLRAARLRSEGEGRKAEILGQMEKELRGIRSEAARSAEEIQGRADAEAARIYGQAYNKDPEFAAFMKTLETYRETNLENTTLILGTDSEFFKYLKGMKR
ncbi:MAG TPA: protease modulator HflC [Deltaproteobacteria bacterium]|jgi:membrane protease subunit HflC|nr:protease modulator HflC [Deltaproteobacteria bacterium]HQH99935.1 protease modulator HflC [Deltaproteobacteria bacterium]